MMLVFGFFFFFVACIVYAHVDLTISKSSASYRSKLQWMRSKLQQIQNVMNRCLIAHDKLEASLRDLSRTGDVQTCKAARKSADSTLMELSKELKPLLSFLQSSSQATQILPKVEELVSKEKESQEKLMLKHSTISDSYGKKSRGREIENRVASIQQKISVLRQEVDDFLEVIDI